jgi:integrase
MEQVRAAARMRHLSLSTEEAYRHWIRRFILFYHKRRPSETGPKRFAGFSRTWRSRLMSLPPRRTQALYALLFLYRDVLRTDLPYVEGIKRARRPARVLVVFTRYEVDSLLAQLTGTSGLIGRLLYGAGLRLMEALRLRVKDVDFDYGQITVRSGKGEKDRHTILPRPLIEQLRLHLARVRLLHEQDMREGCGAVQLPYALARKYPRAAREWAWQYVFPSANLHPTKK